MNPYYEHAEGIAELQNELGDDCPTITWRGVTLKCLISGSNRSKEIDPGGFGMESDLSVVCLRSEIGYETDEQLVAALLKSQLNHNGHVYRVQAAVVAPGGKWVTIKAQDLNKGV